METTTSPSKIERAPAGNGVARLFSQAELDSLVKKEIAYFHETKSFIPHPGGGNDRDEAWSVHGHLADDILRKAQETGFAGPPGTDVSEVYQQILDFLGDGTQFANEFLEWKRVGTDPEGAKVGFFDWKQQTAEAARQK